MNSSLLRSIYYCNMGNSFYAVQNICLSSVAFFLHVATGGPVMTLSLNDSHRKRRGLSWIP